MKILFLSYNRTETNSFYRSAGIATDLMKQSAFEITCASMSEIVMNWATISSFDLIMLQRPHTIESLNLCQFIKQCNVKLWVDYDDNLFAVNPDNPNYLSIYSKPIVLNNIKNIIEIADVVSVTNQYLKVFLSSINSNTWVIPNAFNDILIKRPEIKPREKMVLWRGGASHESDLMCYGAEIRDLTFKYKDWQFLFLGYLPHFLGRDIENLGAMEMQDVILYFKNILRFCPSVLHIPLHDNPFNRCRSNIGYIEGSYAGAVCIVPDWWSVQGALPYSDPVSYYEALNAVLSGEVDIQAKNKEAWEYISDCLFLSHVNKQRIKLIKSL